MKRIGILGSGMVGQTLGEGFLRHGFEVKIGTRDPGKLKDWLAAHPGASAGTFQESAAFGDALVLAGRGDAAGSILEMAGTENTRGKLIMDATNPISGAPDAHGLLPFFTRLDQSLMEQLQSANPEAHLVKVFNSVGAARMVNPELSIRPSMFICGNNPKAKAEVKSYLDLFGWDTEDMGDAEAARAIEPLCMLWCIPGFRDNSWTHAFKLIRA